MLNKERSEIKGTALCYCVETKCFEVIQTISLLFTMDFEGKNKMD